MESATYHLAEAEGLGQGKGRKIQSKSKRRRSNDRRANVRPPKDSLPIRAQRQRRGVLGLKLQLDSCCRQAIFNPSEQFQIYRMSRSEEHTSELQSLMRISYAVFYLKKKKNNKKQMPKHITTNMNLYTTTLILITHPYTITNKTTVIPKSTSKQRHTTRHKRHNNHTSPKPMQTTNITIHTPTS